MPERTREEYSGSSNYKKHCIGNWKHWKVERKKQVLATASEAGQQSGAFSFTFGVRRVCKSTTHYYTSPF